MAKVAARSANIAIDGVSIEDDIDNFSLTVNVETPETTSFADAGPRRVLGNYDFSLDISGAADFAAAQTDATLFNLTVDAAGGAMAVDPTGASAATNDPNYASTVMCSTYTLSGAVGARVSYSATLVGIAALTRATS